MLTKGSTVVGLSLVVLSRVPMRSNTTQGVMIFNPLGTKHSTWTPAVNLDPKSSTENEGDWWDLLLILLVSQSHIDK